MVSDLLVVYRFLDFECVLLGRYCNAINFITTGILPRACRFVLLPILMHMCKRQLLQWLLPVPQEYSLFPPKSGQNPNQQYLWFDSPQPTV